MFSLSDVLLGELKPFRQPKQAGRVHLLADEGREIDDIVRLPSDEARYQFIVDLLERDGPLCSQQIAAQLSWPRGEYSLAADLKHMQRLGLISPAPSRNRYGRIQYVAGKLNS